MVNLGNDAFRDALAAKRRKLTEFVGTRENASLLFQPRVVDAEVHWAGALILQRLNFVAGTNALYSNFNLMSDADVTDWGPRCWANTVAHLCGTDPEVKTAFSLHQTMLPGNPAALDLMIGKVHACFQFFLWIVAGPTRPLDPENSCCVKLIVLKDAILLENIQAKRAGTFGGWGLLDKTIAGLRELGAGFEIGRIKAIATNERIYHAFLRREFRDQVELEGFIHHVENYSKPVELRFDY